MALRFAEAVATEAKGQIKANRFIGESMLVLASVLHLGRSGLPSKAITNDDADRIALNLKVRRIPLDVLSLREEGEGGVSTPKNL